jgi:hypothetical protein
LTILLIGSISIVLWRSLESLPREHFSSPFTTISLLVSWFSTTRHSSCRCTAPLNCDQLKRPQKVHNRSASPHKVCSLALSFYLRLLIALLMLSLCPNMQQLCQVVQGLPSQLHWGLLSMVFEYHPTWPQKRLASLWNIITLYVSNLACNANCKCATKEETKE